MKRWFVFFFIVAMLVAMAGLGGFSGATAEGEASGATGISKVMIFSALSIVAVAYAGWIAYASYKQREGARMHERDMARHRFDAPPHPPGDQPSRSR